MSVRGGAHVIPRWIGGRPYDAADIDPLNRMPWRLMNLIFGKAIARELGPLPPSWPVPTQRPIEGIPIISSDLVPAVRRGDVVIKPGLERLRGGRASFVDGTGSRSTGSSMRPGTRSAFRSWTLRSHPLPAASFRCIDESFRPVWAASSSPASSMRREWLLPVVEIRARGSSPRSQAAFASRRRNGCGRPSTEPSAAPGSASRRRAREASAAIRTRTVDCCTRTCGERGGAGSGARLRIHRKLCGTKRHAHGEGATRQPVTDLERPVARRRRAPWTARLRPGFTPPNAPLMPIPEGGRCHSESRSPGCWSPHE
jgi:hypothetical protein